MVKRVLHAIIELQLWQMKFWRQGPLQDTSCERSIGSFKHAIEVHCCLSLHGIFHFIELLSQTLHKMVIIMSKLPHVFSCTLSLAVLRATGFLVMSVMAASMIRNVTALKVGLVFQLFILPHQLLYIRC